MGLHEEAPFIGRCYVVWGGCLYAYHQLYSPSTIEQRQAKDFLASALEIINWADGRLSTGGFALVMSRQIVSKKPDPQVQPRHFGRDKQVRLFSVKVG